jgi:hypothetical protein
LRSGTWRISVTQSEHVQAVFAADFVAAKRRKKRESPRVRR